MARTSGSACAPVRRLSALAALAAALLAAPGSHAQQPGRGADLVVTVLSGPTGEPIAGARVRIEGTSLAGTTNGAGSVRFGGLRAGFRTVSVEMMGLAPRKVAVSLTQGAVAELPVTLGVAPVALEAVDAEAERRTRGMRRLQSVGFYERREGGSGTFITREQIERQRPRYLSDLLRRHASLRLQSGQFASRARVGSRRFAGPVTRCEPLFFVNGVPAARFDPNDIPPEDVEGIEIYDGPADLPPIFNRQHMSCGAVVVWTRIN